MYSLQEVLRLDKEPEENQFNYYANVAVSFDSLIAQQGHPIQISDENDWAIVHSLRNNSIGILVGSTTVLVDDPSLLVKTKYVKNPTQPVRIVLDRRGRLSGREKVFKNQEMAKTIWVTSKRFRFTNPPNFEILKVPEQIRLRELLPKIEEKVEELTGKTGWIMVEGGAQIIKSFIENDLIERLRIYRSSKILGSGLPLFARPLAKSLCPISVQLLSNGIEEIYCIE